MQSYNKITLRSYNINYLQRNIYISIVVNCQIQNKWYLQKNHHNKM